MSTSDYEVHLPEGSFNSLWRNDDSESVGAPFGEDDAYIAALIEEELGPPRRRGRARKG